MNFFIRYGIVLGFCLAGIAIILILHVLDLYEETMAYGLSAVIGLYYLLFAIIVTIAAVMIKNEPRALTFSLGLTFAIAGYFFKIQHWPGSNILLVVGAVAIGSSFLFSWSKGGQEDEEFLDE